MYLYTVAIFLLGLGIKIASIQKSKAKLWVQGRKNWQQHLSEKIKNVTLSGVEGNSQKIIWVHCASYGEFEQGRTLIEGIKKAHPAYKIVLTFYSPSGYEAFKNWQGAHIICYLPLDTKKNATTFLEILKPQKAIFIKYEFWLNYINVLSQKNIPTYLVSGVFKSHHPFFKWYGGIFRNALKKFTQLFIQDENSGKLLKNINVLNYQITGDTRFDRVIDIKNNFIPLPYFEKFCADNKIIIAGSTYLPDAQILIEAYQNLNQTNLKLIIAPHDVDEKNITQLKELFAQNNLSFVTYSENKENNYAQILIIDTIGLLNKTYHYATITYIGGGFNNGLHNTLEPAVFLKPVLFYGNDFEKFNEAVDLINLGAAKNINSSNQLKNELQTYLNNPQLITSIEEKLKLYFQQNGGSSQKVIAGLGLE